MKKSIIVTLVFISSICHVFKLNAQDLTLNYGNIFFNNEGWDNSTIYGGQSTNSLKLFSNNTSSNGSFLELAGPEHWGWGGSIGAQLYYDSLSSNSYAPNVSFQCYNLQKGIASILSVIDHSGNMSIGNIMPTTQRLTIDGDINLYNSGSDAARNIMGFSTSGSVNIYSGSGNVDGGGISLFAPTALTHAGSVQLIAKDTTPGAAALELVTYTGTGFYSLLRANKDGKVIIGKDIISNIPGDYNLYVSKGILTEKLKVSFKTDNINWSDFVFNPDYQLMPLHEVEDYVNEHKHLPEIPSATDVAKDGIDVAVMDAKLLQKIEELTLYIIEQQKNISQQQKSLAQQQASMAKQQEEINELKKRLN